MESIFVGISKSLRDAKLVFKKLWILAFAGMTTRLIL
jgi:hypothetical protein